ncbi:MAG: septal ring lytic transglycosylase RlpA family protein [Geminocystis sp.]|nr:septal ring lytic transglycosylase RlpA family protein [Geminocystis sp.]
MTMNEKFFTKVAKGSVLTTLISIGITGQSPEGVEAKNYPKQQEKIIVPVENVLARNATEPIKEFRFTRLYRHQLQNRGAITLYYQNTPLLTFLETPNGGALDGAVKLAEKLEAISDKPSVASQINVIWNADNDYSLVVGNEELIRLNQHTILPDSTDNSAEDALQLTNRLRRLVGGAPPLRQIQGQPKTVVKNNFNPLAPVKNLRKAAHGIASWYGPGFHGRRTASGQRFNQHEYTAAHPSLPFGTLVRVTNVRNGRSVVVRINDRGPRKRGRIIDLSAAAARALGLKSSGIAPVTIQVIGR